MSTARMLFVGLLASTSAALADYGDVTMGENGGFLGISLNSSYLCADGCTERWTPNVVGVFGYTHESPDGQVDKAIVATERGNVMSMERMEFMDGKYIAESDR